jgi:hypothetical protein
LFSFFYYTILDAFCPLPFGTWEDYAVAFVAGGLIKGVTLGKFSGAVKFIGDVAVRPMLDQVVKMGTQDAEFSWEKYAYSVATRALTYNLSFGKYSTSMFGSDFSIVFSKTIMRGYLSGFGKKYIL